MPQPIQYCGLSLCHPTVISCVIPSSSSFTVPRLLPLRRSMYTASPYLYFTVYSSKGTVGAMRSASFSRLMPSISSRHILYSHAAAPVYHVQPARPAFSPEYTSPATAYGSPLYFAACVLDVKAGYYECPHCKALFVPTMRDYVKGIHTLTRRRLTCPICGKVGMCKRRVVR